MSFTSGNVLTRVTSITRDLVTTASQIQEQLIATLLDLSKRDAFLKAESTGTVVATDLSITKPTDFSSLDVFNMDDETASNAFELPLMTFSEFLRNEKDGCAVRGNTIYFRPQKAARYTLYYGKKHAASAATIEFDDDFREAVAYGVAAKIFEDKGMTAQANRYIALYEAEIDKLIDDYDEPSEPGNYERVG